MSPGVIYADRVIVQTEHMKEMYVKKLIDYYGDDTEEYWNSKITCGEYDVYSFANKKSKKSIEDNSACKDVLIDGDIYNGNVPDKWKDIVYKKDGTRKKIILYYTSVCGLYEHGIKMIEKMKYVISTFRENADNIALVWYLDPKIDEVIGASDKALYDKYLKLVEEYKEDGFGMILTMNKIVSNKAADVEDLVDMIDAYYGDADKLVTKFIGRKIPVMLQNVEV